MLEALSRLIISSFRKMGDVRLEERGALKEIRYEGGRRCYAKTGRWGKRYLEEWFENIKPLGGWAG